MRKYVLQLLREASFLL
ncbi:hypothetical protein D030_4446A, partial [Vibrio parahaemolyticus AQ3810]